MKKGMIAGLLLMFASFTAINTVSAQDNRQGYQHENRDGYNRQNDNGNRSFDRGYHKENTYYGYKRRHRSSRPYYRNGGDHRGYNSNPDYYDRRYEHSEHGDIRRDDDHNR